MITRLRIWITKFRSAVTGKFVTKDYAEQHPETTIAESRRRKIRKLRKDMQ